MDRPMTPDTLSQIDFPATRSGSPPEPLAACDILIVGEALSAADSPKLGRLDAAEKVRSIEPERMTCS